MSFFFLTQQNIAGLCCTPATLEVDRISRFNTCKRCTLRENKGCPCFIHRHMRAADVKMPSHLTRGSQTKGQIASFLASALSFVRVADIRPAVFGILK